MIYNKKKNVIFKFTSKKCGDGLHFKKEEKKCIFLRERVNNEINGISKREIITPETCSYSMEMTRKNNKRKKNKN